MQISEEAVEANKLPKQADMVVARLSTPSVPGSSASIAQEELPRCDDESWRAACVAALRCCLLGAQNGIDAAQTGLNRLQPTIGRSTRAGFLRTLPELIGAAPSRHWHEEWAALSAEYLSVEHPELMSMSEVERHEFIEMSPIHAIEGKLRDYDGLINALQRRGWERRHAEAYTLLYPLRAPLSRALSKLDDRFGASTCALSPRRL